jgi:GNAT superfamily N-acetyltransferase
MLPSALQRNRVRLKPDTTQEDSRLMPEYTNLSTTNGVDLSFRQMLGAWRIMCAPSPGRTDGSEGGVDFVFSGIPVPFFNVALVTDPRVSSDALASCGRRACAWAADKHVPWLFVVTHDTLDADVDAAAVLDGCGLAPAMPLTGMLAPHVAPAARVPDGLQLALPADDGLCEAAVDINAAAYGMDLEAGKTLIGRRQFWDAHYLVVGVAEGAPVCSAAVMIVDGLRYVALVATLPDRQRRGFADAAMRRALEVAAAAHGEIPTVLHATEAGRPVYERMGYSAISSHTLFMEKRFLEEH